MIGAKSSMGVTAMAAAEATGRLTIMTEATVLEVEAGDEMAGGVLFAGADGPQGAGVSNRQVIGSSSAELSPGFVATRSRSGRLPGPTVAGSEH